MKMKKILFNILIIVGILLLPQSCSEDFLEVNPTQSVSEADVFTTTTNAWAAINGIHRLLYQQGGAMDRAGQSAQMIHNDFMGDDVVPHAWQWFVRSSRWMEHDNENGGHVWHRWRFYYQVISNANMIIAYVDDAEGPRAEREFIKGQALAYRAWAHHNLVQFYADRYDWTSKPNNQLGVPLMLEPTTEGQPRETVENVYAQIMTDYTDAIALLEGKVVNWDTNTPKSHITQSVAQGLKARAALTMGEWQLAATLANQARQGHVLMSHAQLLDGFSDWSNPEFIWACYVPEDQTTYFHSFFAFMSYNFSSTNIRSSPKAMNSLLYNMISDTDVRKQQFAETAAEARDRGLPGNFVAVNYHSFKFRAVGGGDSRGDVPYMRTAELFLMEAEGLARAGQYGPAAQALHQLVSARDPQYTLSNNTGNALIEEIMTHRRIELWGEGHRWLDLKRLNLPLNRLGTNYNPGVVILMEYPAGGPLWTSLIPRNELDANEHMVQNVH